jgi:hypothetical protein
MKNVCKLSLNDLSFAGKVHTPENAENNTVFLRVSQLWKDAMTIWDDLLFFPELARWKLLFPSSRFPPWLLVGKQMGSLVDCCALRTNKISLLAPGELLVLVWWHTVSSDRASSNNGAFPSNTTWKTPVTSGMSYGVLGLHLCLVWLWSGWTRNTINNSAFETRCKILEIRSHSLISLIFVLGWKMFHPPQYLTWVAVWNDRQESSFQPIDRRSTPFGLGKIATWLILPVVIRSSQRLSHACLSINLLLWNCERLIISVIVYLIVPYYLDNRSNSRANTCVNTLLG